MIVAIVGQARGRAVVHHEAVLAQHHAVARLADRQGGERVDVEAVEEVADVGALHVDLAEGRDVAEPDRRRARRAPRGRPLASQFVSPWRGKLAARSHGPASMNTAPCSAASAWVGVSRVGRKSRAAMMAGEGARARPACRRPEHGRRRSPAIDLPGSSAMIARPLTLDSLALVGRHAERGVALEMLDRAEALALRQREVVGGRRRSGNRRRPCLASRATCQNGVSANGASAARGAAGALAANRQLGRGLRALRARRRRGRRPGRNDAGGGAGDDHAAAAASPGTKAASASFHSGLPPRWQARCSDGFQAAGHGEQIAPPAARVLPIGAERRSARPAPCHGRRRPRAPRIDAQPARFRAAAQGRAPARAARIDDRGHVDAGIGGVEWPRVQRGVVVGEHRQRAARRDAEAVDIGRGRRRPASRRAGRCRRTRCGRSMRAGREHRALRATMRHRRWRGVMRRAARPDGRRPAPARRRCRRHRRRTPWCAASARTLGSAAQFGQRRVDASRCRPASSIGASAQQAAAEARNPPRPG